MQHVAKSRALRLITAVTMLTGLAVVPACGGGMSGKNGQPNDLYSKTFAGQNQCNPKNADRPFIINWDATDQSSFQAQTQSDVVFVEYKGCELKVLNGCRDDSVKGTFGSYKSIEWTSGGIETIDIKDEGELYAKLPLGAASLGGRVESGEKFHMEYYVSGTRTATRDHVYTNELSKNPACASATHFVYQYNLGAFALAASSKLKTEVNGSYFGFGAGGSNSNESSADKKGGKISACTGDSAKEVDDCKVPIRLTLREISNGDNPEVAEAKAPETDASLNLAGQLKAENEAQKKAEEHMETAKAKMQAKDGKGCLAELDAHDKLDTRPAAQSTNYKSGYYAYTRAQCLMLAGQCDAGKTLFRKAWESQNGASSGPEQIDKVTEANAALWCQGKLGDRDALIQARTELQAGAYTKTLDAKVCMADVQKVKTLSKTVKPKDDDDTMVKDNNTFLMSAGPNCLAKAGDCAGAFKVFVDAQGEFNKEKGVPATKDPKVAATIAKSSFEAIVPKCKGKAP
jgi:hypothetical protein